MRAHNKQAEENLIRQEAVSVWSDVFGPARASSKRQHGYKRRISSAANRGSVSTWLKRRRIDVPSASAFNKHDTVDPNNEKS